MKVKIGGIEHTLFADTGSEHTIVPPQHYNSSMGPIIPPDIKLRAWGATDVLNVIGMVHTTIENSKGMKVNSKIYIADGFQPEPLLGDTDAERLGFIIFNRDGTGPTSESVKRIPQLIRNNLGVTVETHPPDTATDPAEIEKIQDLVEEYKGLVFDDNKVGCIETPPIHFEYDTGHTPRQPPFHNIPIHYQEQVSQLLDFLRQQGVITDVDPRNNYDCVMNVVITDKKNGQIRMNIDNTPRNPGMKRTKFHVQTPQEIRHDLKEATIFSEMDMGWGYHQLLLDEESKDKSVFQTHEGLHRMERLYFGPTAASGIFHNEVRKCFAGLEGVTTIHDNLLVFGKTYADHFEKLKAVLDRCAEKGIVLKPSKSTFGLTRIKWFGRDFHSNGVTADSTKIDNIREGGRPSNTEEVRSLLMACQYNAKFVFDNTLNLSYEEVTAPLRRLLKKDEKFCWGAAEEKAYCQLLQILEDPSTLQPYDPTAKTHLVVDTSEVGTQASIYQEKETTGTKARWVPVDHCSRALTEIEQGYSPIERESLGLSWGLEQFRYYLLGSPFTAWTDHEPLLSLYNNNQKRTSRRIGSHRDKIQDLDFRLRYLRGRDMPCDYGSRHPNDIAHLTKEEQESLGFDVGNTIHVRKVINLNNSPDAISLTALVQAAKNDGEYLDLIAAITNGQRMPPDSPVNQTVFSELCVKDNLLLRGHKIFVPNASERPGQPNIRTKLLDIAHEGHPGENMMKRYVRSQLWFPGMDDAIETVVRGCLACQASTATKHRDPNTPTPPPDHLWQKLSADHWGPTADGHYLLVVIDELSRYPEVIVVKGTGAEENIEAFDSIFSRHGYCERLKTDNGPPFNGNENHLLQRYFKWAGIDHQPTLSAEDPEANGLAEAFMKMCRKLWHTAIVERNDPRAELNKMLHLYRSTPHPTTGKPPAELLFGRRFQVSQPRKSVQTSLRQSAGTRFASVSNLRLKIGNNTSNLIASRLMTKYCCSKRRPSRSLRTTQNPTLLPMLLGTRSQLAEDTERSREMHRSGNSLSSDTSRSTTSVMSTFHPQRQETGISTIHTRTPHKSMLTHQQLSPTTTTQRWPALTIHHLRHHHCVVPQDSEMLRADGRNDEPIPRTAKLGSYSILRIPHRNFRVHNPSPQALCMCNVLLFSFRLDL